MIQLDTFLAESIPSVNKAKSIAFLFPEEKIAIKQLKTIETFFGDFFPLLVHSETRKFYSRSKLFLDIEEESKMSPTEKDGMGRRLTVDQCPITYS